VTITDFLWDLQVLIFRDFLQLFFLILTPQSNTQ